MVKRTKEKFLIFVEGDSEELYFSALKQQDFVRASKYKLDIINCGGINKLLDIALKKKHYKKELKETNKIVFVVDKDHMTLEQYNELVNKNNYIVGFTNPQIELWFLAHFEKIQDSTVNIISELNNHIPKYYKTHPKISELVIYWERAEDNLKNHSNLRYEEICCNLGSVIRSIIE